MGSRVGENPAALRAAVFLLSAKNRRGVFKHPPAGRRLKLSLQPYFVYECILVPSCLCECEGCACVCTWTAAVSGSRPVAVFEPINNKPINKFSKTVFGR